MSNFTRHGSDAMCHPERNSPKMSDRCIEVAPIILLEGPIIGKAIELSIYVFVPTLTCARALGFDAPANVIDRQRKVSHPMAV